MNGCEYTCELCWRCCFRCPFSVCTHFISLPVFAINNFCVASHRNAIFNAPEEIIYAKVNGNAKQWDRIWHLFFLVHGIFLKEWKRAKNLTWKFFCIQLNRKWWLMNNVKRFQHNEGLQLPVVQNNKVEICFESGSKFTELNEYQYL